MFQQQGKLKAGTTHETDSALFYRATAFKSSKAETDSCGNVFHHFDQTKINKGYDFHSSPNLPSESLEVDDQQNYWHPAKLWKRCHFCTFCLLVDLQNAVLLKVWQPVVSVQQESHCSSSEPKKTRVMKLSLLILITHAVTSYLLLLFLPKLKQVLYYLVYPSMRMRKLKFWFHYLTCGY